MIDYADKSYLETNPFYSLTMLDSVVSQAILGTQKPDFSTPSYLETAREIAQERARIIREKLQYVKAEDTDIYPTFRKVANIRRVRNGLVVDALQ